MDYYWQLKPEWVPLMMRVQKQCFIEPLQETEEAYHAKLKMFPEGCIGCFFDDCPFVDLVAQLIFHPWNTKIPIPMNSHVDKLPDECDCLYLQEIAIDPAFRGKGILGHFKKLYMEYAHLHGFKTFRGVSVQGSLPILQRWGFEVMGETMYNTEKGILIGFTLPDAASPNHQPNQPSSSEPAALSSLASPLPEGPPDVCHK
jgi:hypothetical protein